MSVFCSLLVDKRPHRSHVRLIFYSRNFRIPSQDDAVFQCWGDVMMMYECQKIAEKFNQHPADPPKKVIP